VERHAGHRTFDWDETEPMAPYLATVDIGRGRLLHTEISGLPAWTMVDTRLWRRSREAIRALPKVIRFDSRAFGPYPFDAAGSIIDRAPTRYAALETQTRPIYTDAPDVPVLVHEMAHEWFGDSVGLTRWPEIWLNEGFATWAEWFYAERHDGESARSTFDFLYGFPASGADFWVPPPGHPGTPKHLFAPSVYLRGGMALEALRIEIGTGALLSILRRWASEHRYGNATIPEFIALAEEVSGRQLDSFFEAWLYKRGKPPRQG
jgi:aminopeptidase N